MQRQEILQRYERVRDQSMRMVAPLAPEDYRVQTIGDVSPVWWNLGHTTWFFARNLLQPLGKYVSLDKKYDYVLNSYYEALGPRIPRMDRGKITRPTNKEIFEYRTSVDQRVNELIQKADEETLNKIGDIVMVGTHHEQQHQELFFTEIKNIYWFNPPGLRPAYSSFKPRNNEPREMSFVKFDGGLFNFGNIESGWCYDNELPVHKQFLNNYEFANRLITNGEFLEFMKDGGYENPLYWLHDGLLKLKENGWKSPMYWEKINNEWKVWTLSGMMDLDLNEPVCHVSFYEADAFAKWASDKGEWESIRLPTEREWEHAARQSKVNAEDGNFLEDKFLGPIASQGNGLSQMLGDVWEWTTSSYEPYPGFKPFHGDLAEYNGKFMNNQRVLRGGSCVTPRDHIRLSYRNFWEPSTRFQFSGIRLAGGD